MLYGKIRYSVTIGRSSIHNTGGPMMSSGLNIPKEKMNEDDTYNALKRIPFKQMYAIWKDAAPPWTTTVDFYYEKYGWTWDGFHDEWNKRYND
jgi:hypothetical protein